MSLLAQRRAFLAAYRKLGSIEAAAADQRLEPSVHDQWMSDWLYRSAFAQVESDMKAGKPPEPPKRKPGRPRKEIAGPPPPKRPPGRPRKNLTPEAPGSPDEPSAPETPPPAPQDAPQSPAEPPGVVGHTFPGDKGYVRLFVAEGEPAPAAPPEPEPPKRQAQEPSPEPALDLTLAADDVQRALIDEYGELDRRMQLRATDTARYESLKRAIKQWFDQVPPDADGTVEGEVYLLHLSARERERHVRDIRELVEIIGLDRLLELATVPIGALENLLGKAHVASLTVEARTGSRRIKAIPKRPAVASEPHATLTSSTH